jgi:prevent-host-death family protein
MAWEEETRCAIKMWNKLEHSVETFSIRDLRERTGDLVREAEAGHLSLVAKHGRPLFVAVPMDEHLLKEGVAVALAVRLFAEKSISLGKAAKLAQLPVEAFIARLGAMGIPAVDYPPEELDAELTAFEASQT